MLGEIAFGLVAAGLLAVSASSLWWMLYAWRTPSLHAATGGRRPPARSSLLDDGEWLPGACDPPRYSFSLLVPARHEQAVLGATLARLAAIDHPSFEVIAVVGHDDPATAAVAAQAARQRPGRVRVVVDSSWPKNKPKALNAGLRSCRGDIVGIFDAEDEVSVDVLRRVEQVFSEESADVVQAGVQLVTLRSGWFSLRNCLEYLFWFRSRLHAHAKQGFVPLGGNTVFIRRSLLEALGGWDGSCLAEDCEIGIRLSVAGARIAVCYDASVATREETPPHLGAFIRQRTRWNQGYLQVLRAGYWRALPTRRQRVMARYVLSFPLIQAVSGLLIPASVLVAIYAHLPLLLTLFGFAPVIMTLISLCIEMAGLSELSRTFFLGARVRDHLKLVVTLVPFDLVLGYAALRAVSRHLRGLTGWEKTGHAGAHRGLTWEGAPDFVTSGSGVLDPAVSDSGVFDSAVQEV